MHNTCVVNKLRESPKYMGNPGRVSAFLALLSSGSRLRNEDVEILSFQFNSNAVNIKCNVIEPLKVMYDVKCVTSLHVRIFDSDFKQRRRGRRRGISDVR